MGSWVREAAMEALQIALVLLRGLTPPPEQDAVCGPIVQRMEAVYLKQAVERIARVREVPYVLNPKHYAWTLGHHTHG